MKKTLIALAAFAVSGASFAEVTISGSLIMGYKQTTSSGTTQVNHPLGLGVINAATPGADAAGFGVDTSEIDITVSENLGGGQNVEAKLALAGADRSGESNTVAAGSGNAVSGRDATLSYTNNAFGRIQMGTTMESAVNSGIPSAGAPVIDMDGKLFEIRTSSDFISYAAPIGPVIFQYKLSESSKGLGLGKGFSGTAGVTVGQRTSDFAVVYAKGPLQLVGVYRSYDNRNSVSIATAEGLTKNEAIAIQAGYDFGVAKLGFGMVNTTASVGAKVSDALIGVSVPAGAWTFGMTLGRSVVSGITDAATSVFPSAPASALTQADFKTFMSRAEGTANSLSVGAKYDFSKRTSLSVKYATWTRSGYEQFEAFGKTNNLGEFGYTANANESSILLAHTF